VALKKRWFSLADVQNDVLSLVLHAPEREIDTVYHLICHTSLKMSLRTTSYC